MAASKNLNLFNPITPCSITIPLPSLAHASSKFVFDIFLLPSRNKIPITAIISALFVYFALFFDITLGSSVVLLLRMYMLVYFTIASIMSMFIIFRKAEISSFTSLQFLLSGSMTFFKIFLRGVRAYLLLTGCFFHLCTSINFLFL